MSVADFTAEQQAAIDAAVADRIATETAGLKANRDELAREAKAAKARLANYEGVDPEKYRKLLADAETAEQKRLEGEGSWSALKTQLQQKHEEDRGKWDSENKRLRGALEARLIDAEASKEIAELKGSVRGLLPHAKPHIRVVEHDGQFVAQVVDGSGNPRIGDAKGTPMSIRQLVEELRSDKELAGLFQGTGSSGGGATKSTGGAGGAKTVAAGDNAAFIRDLKGIASGEITVVGNG